MKPDGCPFCGSLSVQAVHLERGDGEDWFCECTACCARGPLAPDRQGAVTAWAARLQAWVREHTDKVLR